MDFRWGIWFFLFDLYFNIFFFQILFLFLGPLFLWLIKALFFLTSFLSDGVLRAPRKKLRLYKIEQTFTLLRGFFSPYLKPHWQIARVQSGAKTNFGLTQNTCQFILANALNIPPDIKPPHRFYFHVSFSFFLSFSIFML